MAEPTPSIAPKGEPLQRAVRWLSSRRMDGDKTPRDKLIDQAALKFDLTPLETEFLLRNFEVSG